MKKIIIGITSLTLGGAERVLIDLSNELCKTYDITVFTLYSNGELESELKNSIKLISMFDKSYKQLSKREKLIVPLKVLFGKKKIFKKYIDNENYDAQIAFLEGPITRIFSVKSKNANTKKIAWIHNDISRVFGKNIKSKIKRIIDRNCYEKYDNLIFVSNDNLDKFNRVYDDIILPKEKVIRNYIDDNRILKLSDEKIDDIYSKDEFNILQISRLTTQKAVDRLIRAHAKLIKDGFKHHIYIIGDGPEKEKLEKLIKEKEVEKTFTLLGAKTNPYPYLKQCDAFALLSEFEGYGIVIDEAKILNKYIMITNTSAREALTDYRDYSYISDNSEEGIIKGIQQLLNNKKLQKNYKYDYTNNKIIDKIRNIIEE